MRTKITIILGLLIISCQSPSGNLGKVVITDQPVYEQEDNYFPHDFFVTKDMNGLLDTAVSIKQIDNTLIIKNIFNDGLLGHAVQFFISSDFEIKDVKYEEWTNMIDGSETKFKVEKVIFTMDKNPFHNRLITGYYTLQIREDFIAGKLLEKDGISDTTSYKIFNGKFKIYSELEKQKGRDWIIDQNEIKMGIRESMGVYHTLDKFAKYKFGDDSLKSIFKQFEINRKETLEETKVFVTLKMIVNENGIVNSESMLIRDSMKSMNLLNKIKLNKSLINDWYPAIYKGVPVKSEVNLPIKIIK